MTYEKDSGMKLDMDPCDLDVTNKTEIHLFPIKEGCRCNSCESACKFDNKFHMNPLKGFNGWVVISFYLFVTLASIIITYCKKYYKGKRSSFNDSHINFNSFRENNNVKVSPINEKSNQTHSLIIEN
jgi:hypothetical protein